MSVSSLGAYANCALCGGACAHAYWCAGCGRFVCWRHEPIIDGAPPAEGEHACAAAWVDDDAVLAPAIAGGTGR